MKIKDLKSAMAASISDVLETMFYMPLEFEDTGEPDKRGFFDIPDLRVCELEFNGSISGRLILMIPESLLVSMAVDFMAEDKSTIKRVHTDGIIKEVANMVAGHMLSHMDDKRDFHLGIPRITENNEIIETFKKNPPECHVLAESINGLFLTIMALND